MGLIERAKNIILTPKTEWDVIAAETTAPAQIVTNYVLPLAGAAAIAGFIGTVLLGSMLRMGAGTGIGLVFALMMAVFHVVMAVVSVFVLAFIIDALAPTFGGTKNFNQALKVVAYSYTPAWVFGLLTIVPILGWLAALVGALYALYLLYLGLPKLMRSPQEKAVPYVVVVIVCAIVLYVVVVLMASAIGGMGMRGMMGAAAITERSASATFDRDSRIAKLDELSKKMEVANKRMEAAQKSGDPNKQTEAAMAVLGTALSGGKGVEPVTLDQLKPFVPQTFAGLPQTDLRTERSGVAGLIVAKAEARYNDSAGKNVRLEVVDTGGAAGLMGLASWMGVQSEREDSSHRESTRKEGTRIVHEEVSKQGGSNKYSVVLNDRFVVSAAGNGVDIDTLKSGVGAVNLAALEAIK